MIDYFLSTTDASHLYRPSSAAGSADSVDAAVRGNLADFMRNSTVYKVPQSVQQTVYYPQTSIDGVVASPKF